MANSLWLVQQTVAVSCHEPKATKIYPAIGSQIIQAIGYNVQALNVYIYTIVSIQIVQTTMFIWKCVHKELNGNIWLLRYNCQKSSEYSYPKIGF